MAEFGVKTKDGLFKFVKIYKREEKDPYLGKYSFLKKYDASKRVKLKLSLKGEKIYCKKRIKTKNKEKNPQKTLNGEVAKTLVRLFRGLKTQYCHISDIPHKGYQFSKLVTEATKEGKLYLDILQGSKGGSAMTLTRVYLSGSKRIGRNPY